MTRYTPDNNVHKKTMTLTGHGEMNVSPDTAIIHLGVNTTGENLSRIQAENARISQSVIQTLQRMGITNIKTIRYTIDRVFEFADGRQIDRGYSVNNILEIRTNNLDAAGSIIDAAVNAGANVVDLITFDVSNREYYYRQALNMAIMNAIKKAESIAVNLGLSSRPMLVNIVENTAMPFPVQREFATTPIMPGTLNIAADVTVDFVF
ncbi:MAG TPA: SIMPL domain-containing protein [Sedimentibacter sp.]|jgi:hypothetical protein|nr:SIMPL domain-containing protein [Sedimentibacter sp.]HHZ01267.1 SIMPL domain-containing protein [Tissierellia bacterium]HOK48865.1 SIMPL domain-containing protein [Sedimentibacter sp.]HOW22277.1 SIMPL domain-containing protein [Sedimentibacter sp.]HRC80373.1 SIMPL domain-containing protein [Sedimentibacter sp.]